MSVACKLGNISHFVDIRSAYGALTVLERHKRSEYRRNEKYFRVYTQCRCSLRVAFKASWLNETDATVMNYVRIFNNRKAMTPSVVHGAISHSESVF